MGLTYSDANASIERNEWFRNRTRVAISTFANYLLNTATSDPDYALKIEVGTRLAQIPDQVLNTIMFSLAGDSEINEAGPAIADAQLQLIVEKTLKKFYPVEAAPAAAAAAARNPMGPSLYPRM